MIKRRNIIFIGGSIIKIIGLSTGSMVIEVQPDTCSLPQDFEKYIADAGVIVVEEEIYNKCSNVKNVLERIKESALVITLPHPWRVIEPKKYYEELLRKIIGLRISL